MKKESVLLTSAGILVLSLGIGSYSNFNDSNLTNTSVKAPTVSAKQVKSSSASVKQEKVEANHAIFRNAEEAEAASYAVVRVIATANHENVLEEQAWGMTGRTVTQVEIVDIYKDSSKGEIGKTLAVIEPSYTTEDENGNLTQFNYEDYELMQEGQEYILFLGLDEKGYWINSLEQGQHAITKSEGLRSMSVEKETGHVNEQYVELRESVLDKYLN